MIKKFRFWLAELIAGRAFMVIERDYVEDVHYRFSCVLNHVAPTMSKTNYTLEAMYSAIDAHIAELCDEAYVRETRQEKSDEL